jgi:hypothetical protein
MAGARASLPGVFPLDALRIGFFLDAPDAGRLHHAVLPLLARRLRNRSDGLVNARHDVLVEYPFLDQRQ